MDDGDERDSLFVFSRTYQLEWDDTGRTVTVRQLMGDRCEMETRAFVHEHMLASVVLEGLRGQHISYGKPGV